MQGKLRPWEGMELFPRSQAGDQAKRNNPPKVTRLGFHRRSDLQSPLSPCPGSPPAGKDHCSVQGVQLQSPGTEHEEASDPQATVPGASIKAAGKAEIS